MQTVLAIKAIQTYDGSLIDKISNRLIYDFGQNVSGMLEFKVKGRSGDVIHAYPAEKLAKDGNVDQMAKNWLDINVCETYIIGKSDEWETFSMTFTYFGGRFVAIEGCDECNIKFHLKRHVIFQMFFRFREWVISMTSLAGEVPLS